MKIKSIYRTVIKSDINNVCIVVKDITNYIAKSYGVLSEDTLFEIKVILNELILNAVKHGNKQDSRKDVKVIAGLAENGYAYFWVEDQGEGHDCRCLTQRNVSPLDLADMCDMKETGRGILIVRNLCDNIKFNFKGNKVVVLKKL